MTDRGRAELIKSRRTRLGRGVRRYNTETPRMKADTIPALNQLAASAISSSPSIAGQVEQSRTGRSIRLFA